MNWSRNFWWCVFVRVAVPAAIASVSPGVGSGAVSQAGQNKQATPAKGGAESVRALDPVAVTREVREAFQEWREAYADGDTKRFLLCFAQIPDLLIRISATEWVGFENYRDAVTQAQMPKTDFEFREVRISPIDEHAAFVSYIRSSSAKDDTGKPLSYRGTLIYARTYSGWKVVAWHTHSIPEPGRPD